MSEIRKMSYTVPMSRELAIAYGLVEPTAEERRRMDAEVEWARQWQARQDARWRFCVAVLRTKGELERRLLDLHTADEHGDCPACGADEAWMPWPCPTVELLAEHHGIELEEPR